MAKKPILTDDELDGGFPLAPSQVARANSATRPVDAPQPMATKPVASEPAQGGRDASGHARPKTRIHGYGNAAKVEEVAIAAPVVGWLVVTAGPGRGAAIELTSGMNAIGRGDDIHVQLDFGDDTISRDAHAYVTYDDEARRFHVSHGGKTNLVRLNNAPVLMTEGLSHGDTLRIGATSLRFIALCGPDFDWSDP